MSNFTEKCWNIGPFIQYFFSKIALKCLYFHNFSFQRVCQNAEMLSQIFGTKTLKCGRPRMFIKNSQNSSLSKIPKSWSRQTPIFRENFKFFFINWYIGLLMSFHQISNHFVLTSRTNLKAFLKKVSTNFAKQIWPK